MEISEIDFRDKAIAEVSVGYDWETTENYAVVAMIDSLGDVQKYRIDGLSEYAIYENFSCGIFDRCKLIIEPDNVYLSLDPYSEATEVDEKDNFYFTGRSIRRVAVKC